MKYLIVLLVLFSNGVFSHSQTPSKIIKAPFYEQESIVITLRNLNDYPQAYEVSVDDKVLGEISALDPDKKRDITVDLKNIKEGLTKKICTTSLLREGQSVRTQVCSFVEFKW